MTEALPEKLGLIAGNGDLPVLIARQCRERGIPCVVAAIREEADPALAEYAEQIQWLGIGQLGGLMRFFRRCGVTGAMMAGKVLQVRIFGKDHPDLRMFRMLARLPKRNADSLLVGIADELAREGITLLDSTLLIRHLVPPCGLLTRRPPDPRERKDIDFGLPIAREIARMDIGQTIVVCHQAVAAVEGLEGTDATIERAAALAKGQKLTVVKVSKPDQDLRFDVPVMGRRTIEVLRACRATAMVMDAGRSLILEKETVLAEADRAGLAIVSVQPPALELGGIC